MKIYEDLISLLEEVINELDDETVQAVSAKRKENAEKAQAEFRKVLQDEGTTGEELEAAAKKANHAQALNSRNKKLVAKREERIKKRVADFKERLLNRKPQRDEETQKAASDLANAMIDQHYRNKLEKAFSHECLEEILSLVEGYLRG